MRFVTACFIFLGCFLLVCAFIYFSLLPSVAYVYLSAIRPSTCCTLSLLRRQLHMISSLSKVSERLCRSMGSVGGESSFGRGWDSFSSGFHAPACLCPFEVRFHSFYTFSLSLQIQLTLLRSVYPGMVLPCSTFL
jgi:hypothetical protein